MQTDKKRQQMVYNYSYALYPVESQIDKQTGPYRGVCRVFCAQGPPPLPRATRYREQWNK